MDTGAIGRSQTPPKAELTSAAHQAGTANPDTVRAAAGKTVPPAEAENQGPSFEDASTREKDQANLQQAQTKIDRRTVIDPETETFLFQLIEQDTGEVKRQIPEESLLNLREYARETLQDPTERSDAT